MRIAIADIGSNSTRLLVAEVDDRDAVTELERRSEVTRLAAGVEASGRLADEAMERVFSALESYAGVIEQAGGVERYVGVMTSASRDAAQARLDQSLLGYRKTVLSALGEVADGLSAYEASAEAQQLQDRRVAITAEALRLAELRFRAGTTSFLEVLDAQRQLLAAQLDAVQALLERRLALVRVYLALGGGWDATQ